MRIKLEAEPAGAGEWPDVIRLLVSLACAHHVIIVGTKQITSYKPVYWWLLPQDWAGEEPHPGINLPGRPDAALRALETHSCDRANPLVLALELSKLRDLNQIYGEELAQAYTPSWPTGRLDPWLARMEERLALEAARE